MANQKDKAATAAEQTPEATTVAQDSSYTDSDLKRDQETVAEMLAARPKQRIRLPLPEGVTAEEAKDGKADYTETVQINGYVIRIMRGHWVEVADVVVEVLERAGKI